MRDGIKSSATYSRRLYVDGPCGTSHSAPAGLAKNLQSWHFEVASKHLLHVLTPAHDAVTRSIVSKRKRTCKSSDTRSLSGDSITMQAAYRSCRGVTYIGPCTTYGVLPRCAGVQHAALVASSFSSLKALLLTVPLVFSSLL